MNRPHDAAARERALDPSTSFVVQAPAGSGKTELLTRRILTLLATVEEPEQVVAITFTKKAAAEMRERVVELLRAAHAGTTPANDYEVAGLALAARVLVQDEARGWCLLDDPQRLALGTIDALATRLAHRLPLTSTLGAPSGVAEEARDLYLEAARRFIEERLPRLDLVLLRLGNRFERLQSLLADLLGVRDQWMRFVMPYAGAGEALRERLEDMLESLVESHLDALVETCPAILHDELPRIARRAALWLETLNLADDRELDRKQRTLVETFTDIDCLPDGTPDDVATWQVIAHFLLTEGGTLRAKLDRNTGFPAKSKPVPEVLDTDAGTISAHKEEMQSLLASLADEAAFVDRLHAVRTLPAPRYPDEDWAVLEQLIGLLPELVAELHLLFGERGRLDFPEIAQRAVTALGSEEQPTDLALSMDMDLRHLLVDEFQDTSRAQWNLFERLVAGWEPDDGRTFFIVGDPMQSIYRFREGDVALFLEARDRGIGEIRFESLGLEVNFRSDPPVIDWINETFRTLFPSVADPNVGAVTYEPSVSHGTGAEPIRESGNDDGGGPIRALAGAPAGAPAGARIHALPDATPEDEARLVAGLVHEALARDAGHTVGILVRSRSAARLVIAALQARDVRFRAVDMEPLGERPVVRDLVSLALALRFPHDRLHWLAVLRGPLCGLRLDDLHVLGADDARVTLLERLTDEEALARLTDDGRERVERFMTVVGPAAKRVSRSELVPWVESLWLRLGGPAACTGAGDLDAAERCLARLVEFERDGRIWQRADVSKAVDRLYASDPPDERASQVQVMTVHKSKGLEFDTVIVPALGRKPAQDTSRLINWYESTLNGEAHLLFAPIDPQNASGEHRNPIVGLVRRLHARAESEERLRLLYVACTRARRHLHLTTPLPIDDKGLPKRPVPTSFLAPLFDRVCAAAATPGDGTNAPSSGAGVVDDSDGATEVAPEETPGGTAPADLPAAPPLLRTRRGWQLPTFDRFAWQGAPPLARSSSDVEHDLAGDAARDVGTVVHRALLQLSRRSEAERRLPDATDLERFTLELKNLGVADVLLDEAAARVALAIANTLTDDLGRWILDPRHRDARSEWAVTVPEVDDDGRFVGTRHLIIDRTFIDEKGTRWVIDYKTGFHEGGGVDEFLDNEVSRYREQLEGYAEVIARIDTRPVRLGLWFPMVGRWRELSPAVDSRLVLV